MFSVRTVVKGQSKVTHYTVARRRRHRNRAGDDDECVFAGADGNAEITRRPQKPAPISTPSPFNLPRPGNPPPHNPLTWFFRVNSRPFKNNIINSFSTGAFTLIFIVHEIGFVKRLDASFCFTILLTRRVTYLSWKQKNTTLASVHQWVYHKVGDTPARFAPQLSLRPQMEVYPCCSKKPTERRA